MSKELHPVVELLLARMNSHPEEFANGASRWGWMINDIMDHGTDEERAALKEGLRPIRLQEVHEVVLDELCNGEERRRKEQEEQEEYERTARTALGAGSMGASLRNALSPAVQQAYDQMQQLGHPGQFITDYDYATQAMRIKDTHTGAVTAVSREQIEDKGFVATMKKALGI